MASSLLRPRHGHHRAEVTSIELFFDLVFVIAVTQVSHALLDHQTWMGALQAAILLAAIWWAWIDTAWITNWLDPEKPLVRLMLLLLMGIGIVMSSSLAEAFGDRGLAFAVAYVVFQVGRTLFMLWAAGRGSASERDTQNMRLFYANFQRILIWYLVSGAIWIAGGFAVGEMRLVLWAIALALDTVGPAVAFWVPGLGRANTRDWNIDGGHMAERTGLFVMIALGESILVTGTGFTQLEWSPEVIGGMSVSLLQAMAMWWLYFSQHAQAASAEISASDDPGRIARQGYTYVPILLIAGIVVSAVGDEIVLAHPFGHEGHIDDATVVILIGGPALFLLGAALFKLAVFGRWSPTRFAGLAATLALFPVAPAMTPLALSAATTGIIVIVAAWETVLVVLYPDRYPVRTKVSVSDEP